MSSEVAGRCVDTHSDSKYDVSECCVVNNEFLEFWEVPSVPFLDAHGVGVELLVQVVEQCDGLDDHCVDLQLDVVLVVI